MINAKVVIESEINRGELNTYDLEFDKVDEIEKFLSYNRSLIRSIELTGKVGA